MVTVVEFHVQVQINFSKLQDSGDARTLAKIFRTTGTCVSLPLTGNGMPVT